MKRNTACLGKTAQFVPIYYQRPRFLERPKFIYLRPQSHSIVGLREGCSLRSKYLQETGFDDC